MASLWRPNLPASRGPGDPLVEAELRRRIRAAGRITFAEYMAVALYLLDGGYYEAHVGLGRSGDFLTSPEAHPVFGALLARLAHTFWRALDRPAPFHVIEYGAGTGALCRPFVTAAPHLDPDFARALRYVIIETSAALRAEQQARLLDLIETVSWVLPGSSDHWPVGCVFANEVVDALPVHRVQVEGGRLRELYVGLAEDRYVDLPEAPFTPDLEAYFAPLDVFPQEGAVTEVCLQSRVWLAEAAGRLDRGYMVTLDYGGTAAERYGVVSPRGQLKCFSHHGWTDDPFDRPGLQDITAPVDFTTLRLAGAELGLEVEAEVSQAELLWALGMGRAKQEVEAGDLPVMERQRNLVAMRMLVDPAGLGRSRALLQRKGAPASGFSGADVEAPIYTPLLPEEERAW